jgi:hypothetical protein
MSVALISFNNKIRDMDHNQSDVSYMRKTEQVDMGSGGFKILIKPRHTVNPVKFLSNFIKF